FIHCRVHVLQLCLLSACKDLPEVSANLSTLKSLINFINRSSIRSARLLDIQLVLKQPQLKLIIPNNTRWLSFSRAVTAAVRCYEPLLIPREHVPNERGENSPDALDLLTVLQDKQTTLISNILEPILETLSILSKFEPKIQPDILNGQGFQESRNPRQLQQATLMDWWPQDFRDQEVSFENGYGQNNHNRGYQNHFQGQARQWQNSRQSQDKAFRYRNSNQNRFGGYKYGPFRYNYRQSRAGGQSNGP
ncbi:unnamed protein product, partial [Didymodactylos carnosus]